MDENSCAVNLGTVWMLQLVELETKLPAIAEVLTAEELGVCEKLNEVRSIARLDVIALQM